MPWSGANGVLEQQFIPGSGGGAADADDILAIGADLFHHIGVVVVVPGRHDVGRGPRLWRVRSEEHTSELQSRGRLVCRVLLAKKSPPWRGVGRTAVCA